MATHTNAYNITKIWTISNSESAQNGYSKQLKVDSSDSITTETDGRTDRQTTCVLRCTSSDTIVCLSPSPMPRLLEHSPLWLTFWVCGKRNGLHDISVSAANANEEVERIHVRTSPPVFLDGTPGTESQPRGALKRFRHRAQSEVHSHQRPGSQAPASESTVDRADHDDVDKNPHARMGEISANKHTRQTV